MMHATCIAISGQGVLLLGESGSGKSDLALRLIYDGAKLVSDDQTEISLVKEKLIANAPERLQGLLEVRGMGIVTIDFAKDIPLALAVKLVPREEVERMPEPAFFDCHGQKIPLLSLHAHDSSTVAKIHLALRSE